MAQKCLSGQQGLNLLRGSGHQVFWVVVGISWAGQSCVNLPVGSANQLCRLAENLLPAQTNKTRENLTVNVAVSNWLFKLFLIGQVKARCN